MFMMRNETFKLTQLTIPPNDQNKIATLIHRTTQTEKSDNRSCDQQSGAGVGIFRVLYVMFHVFV